MALTDIRQYVKKRKISAGTRSDAGRRCRDTFLSLKTTCRKLGVTFWQYLQDRIQHLDNIPPLAELIQRKATEPATESAPGSRPAIPIRSCSRRPAADRPHPPARGINHRVIEKSPSPLL